MKTTSTLVLVCFIPFLLLAEGTRELAPNANIVINGSNTNDIAALHINSPNYNNFASYTNADPNSRLFIHIIDPSQECINLGFSIATPNGSPTVVEYEYRIIDPNGQVVFGPILVNSGSANINGWNDASVGPANIYGASGYSPVMVSSADLQSQGWTGKGDYYIEFQATSGPTTPFLINYWDITVADCSGVQPIDKKGRIWSYNWAFFAINDFDFPNRPFNGAFYVCAPDPANPDAAFVTLVDFNGSGFRPAAFNIAFNSFGVVNTGNIVTDRQSVENLNLTTAEYEIFLNDPIDLCQTASIGDIELVGISRCSIDDFCIKFSSTRIGQLDLLLDFDQMDGIFTPGTADILLTVNIDSSKAGEAMCLDWDGFDGLGQKVIESSSTQVPIVVSFAQGIYHFPIYDAELMTTGITIHSIRPAGPDPLVYYDDSNISVPSGTGEPQIQLSGCNIPCHGWTNYTTPGTTGFGNLNTINTWWFSRQTITENVFPLPAYLECEISGPDEICEGDTDTLKVNFDFLPMQAIAGQVVSYDWQGPGISGTNDKEYILITTGGTFDVSIAWLTALGDTCQSECSFSLQEGESREIYIDTLILRGDTVRFNNEAYFENGKYLQSIQTNFGCDSLIHITVRIAENILHYDFDDCRSFVSDSSHQVYKEFTAKYPNGLNCASLSAEFLHREMPIINPHSCTPGVNNSPAMCVSSLDSCDFHAGNDKSIVFEVTLDPDPDTAIMITHLCFYERAPINFEWLNGPTGPNNYPTLYGIRVLKNGTEIYREEDIATTTAWSKETFDFRQLPDFASKEKAIYRFELLGYCLVGDTSKVTAWDMDELSVLAACVSPAVIGSTLSGVVMTDKGIPLESSQISLDIVGPFKKSLFEINDENGYFAFPHLSKGSYTLSANNQTDYLNGVSTADVVAILRHLLGKEDLVGHYNHIQADVDRSKSISVSDLVQLRKLILGKTQRFSSETSWLIIDHDPESPLTSPWSYDNEIDILFNNYDDQEIELIGLKLGDVTGDAKHGTFVNEPRNTEKFEIIYSNAEWNEGMISEIPFYANSTINLSGIQLALEGFEMINVISNVIDIDNESYYIDNGNTLNISWAGRSNVQVEKGDILFTLVVRCENSEGFEPSLTIDKSRIASEVYNEFLEASSVVLTQSSISSIESKSEFKLNAFPNPFTNDLTFEFADAIENDVSLALMSIDGKVLKSYRFDHINAGQRISIDASELKTTNGILLYEFKNQEQSTIGRLTYIK